MNIRFFAIWGLTSGLSLLAACAPPEQTNTQQPPAAAPPATPLAPAVVPDDPPGSWIDWPIAAGDWVYRRDSRGSIALFGPMNSEALVTLRCDTGRRRVFLARKSGLASAPMTIRTSARLKEFSARTTGGTQAYLATELLASDPILDAMAYSRGRIALQAKGTRSLAIPVWSEIGRVIDDCR